MKNKKTPKVTVLIPAVNEEKTIGKIVKDCLKIKQYKITVLLIIDSKTIDNTRENAKKAGAKVIHIGKGLGKGTAIKRSIPYIRDKFVVQIDADYQFQPHEIPKLINPLMNGFDVTLGTRYQKDAIVEKNSVSTINLLGSYFLSAVTSFFAMQRITDVMAGFKGFKTECLRKIKPTTNHFGYEAELVIKASQKRYKIINIPITYKKRGSGLSNVNSLKHGFLVLGTILKTGLKL